ncbi:MAG: hypothetical protein ACXU8A_00190 [Burkholderiaceae bacterium]
MTPASPERLRERRRAINKMMIDAIYDDWMQKAKEISDKAMYEYNQIRWERNHTEPSFINPWWKFW